MKNFLLLPRHRNRCTESTKLGWQSVISCFKESDAGDFKHWGWGRWETQKQARSPNTRHEGSRGRAAGVAELDSDCRRKVDPEPPRAADV